MEILNSPTVQSASQLATKQDQTGAALSSDFETFLKMLTAQARNQDPLEPIDSSEYAAQLAQFSMVEQQVLSNDLLTDLAAQIGSNSIGEMATLIGMEARTTKPVAFEGAALTILPKIEAGADEAFLIAYDSSGTELQRRAISISGEPIEWLGLGDGGSMLPNGNYSFTVESRSIGETIGSSPAETYSRITEARRDGTNSVFVLNSGATVTSSEISGLRETL